MPLGRVRARPLAACSRRILAKRHLSQCRPLFSAINDLPIPPTAPKATINLKAIRQSPEYHSENCINRNYKHLAESPQKIIAVYEEWVQLQKAMRSDRERRNSISQLLRTARPVSETPGEVEDMKERLLEEGRQLKAKMSEMERKESELEAEMKSLGSALPNSTHHATPIGTEPKLLGYINPELAPTENTVKDAESHTHIGSELGLIDFSAASTVSGWGWYYLLNEAVLMEHALVNYALSLAMQRGWKLVSPPSMVYSHISAACGFQPRDQSGEQQIYVVEGQEGKMRHVLAGTAEIPLAAMYADKTFSAEDLPMKVIGVGRAYRAEAGARGLEGKGLYRVHEFTKVELFAWAAPPAGKQNGKSDKEGETSAFINHCFEATSTNPAEDLFNEMLDLQKTFLTSLGLHARILEMPTTDLGASAARKIDIEAYMPSRAVKDPWGEVSSLSNCTDYQSRRLNTRAKITGKTDFPYTLNGTACAVPRVLIAILENGWTEDRGGGVVVPKVLRPFMGGIDFIGRKR